MCCKCYSATQRKMWVFGYGTIIVLFAIALGILWPSIYEKILFSELVLENGTTSYKNWISTPIPMYLELHLFHWENPDEVNNPDVKPKFKEMGPYVFKEHHDRVDLDWHKGNDSLSFYQIRTWHFVPEKSNGSLTDEITCPNVLGATVAYMVRHQPKAVQFFANLMLEKYKTQIHKTATVNEWLFEGYNDPLLDFLKEVNSSAINIPFKRFGWFVERNESKTYDGRFTIYTGEDDLHKLGIMTHWNGDKHTRYYEDKCGIVNGTTGELWPPEMEADKPKTIFATDICRFVNLYAENKTTFKGVEGTKYVGTDQAFDNGDKYPTNKCFCKEEKRKNNECPKSGVLDVSECKFGAPVTVSYPHFYLADESYIEDVEGMSPDPAKHELSMALETSTGIPMQVNARLQINMLMREYPMFSIFKHIPKHTMMPLFWFRQTAELDDDLSSKVKMAINLRKIGIYISYTLGFIGALTIVIGIILTITKRWKRHISQLLRGTLSSPQSDDEDPLIN